MSDTSVNVTIGGNASAFQAACQSAAAQMQAFRATVAEFSAAVAQATTVMGGASPAMQRMQAAANLAAMAMKDTGAATQQAGEAAKTAQGSMSGAAASMHAAGAAATEAGHGVNSGILRELIVLGHEGMSGNYNRIPGSFMVLAERVHLTSLAMVGGVAAAAGLGLAFYHLARNAYEAEMAMRGVYDAAQLQGRGAVAAEAAARKWGAAMYATGTVSQSAANTLAGAVGRIGGLSDQTREKLAALAPALANSEAIAGRDAEKTAEAMEKIFASTHAMSAFVDENRLLTADQKRSFDAALATRDAFAAQNIVLDALAARYKGFGTFAQETRAAWDDLKHSLALSMAMVPHETPKPAPLRIPDVGTRADDEATRRLTAVEGEYNRTLRDTAKLKADEKILTDALAAAETPAAKARLQAELDDLHAQQELLKARGDASWAEKQRAALDAVVLKATAGAKTTEALERDKAQATVAFWDGVARQTGITEAERTQAVAAATQARMALRALEVRHDATGAREGEQSQIAALSAEQAAHRENFTEWMALEQRKLALLKAAHGEASANYQRELRAMETYEREWRDKQAQEALKAVDAENQAGQKGLQATQSRLSQEVSEQQLTKSQEVALAEAAALREYAIELTRLSNFAATLDKETAAYRTAKEQQLKLAAQFGAEMAALDAREAAAARDAAQRVMQEYTGAFDRIGSTAERTIGSLITGQTTWKKAEMQVAGAVVDAFTSMCMTMVGKWAVMELAKTSTTEAGLATRKAVEVAQENGSTGLAVLLARWLGLETGKTAATGAQAAARTGIQASADVTAAAAAAAANTTEALSYAGVGAAAAGASVAAIPITGWAMAPGVAAETFATLAAFGAMASAEGGWGTVPMDGMIAQLHKNEMVLPAQYAQVIRDMAAPANGNAPRWSLPPGNTAARALAGGPGGGAAAAAGGDTHVHFNVSAMDGPSVAAWINGNAAHIARTVARYAASNPSVRPA